MEALQQGLLARWGGDARSERLRLPGFSRAQQVELYLSRCSRQALHDDAAVEAWLTARRAAGRMQSTVVPLTGLAGWRIESASGNIVHDTGRFFSITGLKVRHRFRDQELYWDQPMIDQPEIGILGILVKRFAGVLHFCLQAKEEPGNLGGVQLSPTVQATYSNYSRRHGGGVPPLVEHFLDPPPERVLFAKLQSEDGGRFLYKSNRNLLVRLADHEEPPLGEEFIWLTLRQISVLLERDNLVNACTRSILAATLGLRAVGRACGGIADDRLLPMTAVATDDSAAVGASLPELVQWFDNQKALHHNRVQRIGLKTLQEWRLDSDGFLVHRDRRFFRVIGLDVACHGREVTRWSQPIIANPQSGIIGLLVRERGGERELLMQCKAEPGNRTTLQLGPTVQFTPSNYLENPRLAKPFLFEAFAAPDRYPLLRESRQSEEGARFYREDHLHRVLLLPPGEELALPDDYRWIGEEQLAFFLHLGVYVNSCARSILACLL